MRSCFLIWSFPANHYLSLCYWSRRARSESCSKLRMKIQERHQRHRSGVFIVKYSTLCSNCWLTFEMISFNFVLLQILLAGRLIRSYLNVDKNASKSKFTWEVKWTHFGVQSILYLGKNLWLRVKTKASLKPGLKTEVFWNTFDKEFAGEIKYVKKNYVNKSSLLNFQNSLPLRVTYVKYLEKNSMAIGIVYSYIFSFLYQFAVKWKACDKHSIHL